jgi:choline dehydrogenase-like flavoprotein
MIKTLGEIGSVDCLSTDLCIIGSGAAGMTIAREFINSPHQVIVLEAGGATIDSRYQDPYRSEVVGLRHNGIHIGRVRALGGTTTLWAGQCLPLFDIDFQKRDWVEHSGWPISRSDLAPFYPRAHDVMQLASVSHDIANWPESVPKPPEYLPGEIDTYYSTFSPMPNFARAHGAAIRAAENIQVLTDANVMSIESTPDASAAHEVKVRSLDGKRLTVRARIFIVCCGGIETARLLLASNSVEPAGIGNSRDVVGRYFQDHPGVIFPVRPTNPHQFSRWFDSFRLSDIRHCIKLAASESLQRSEKILHAGGEVFYPAQEDDPIDAAKLVVSSIRNARLRPQVPRALLRIAKRPDRVMRAVYRRYVKKQVASVGTSQPFFGISVEQQANPHSRVTLSNSRDSLGMPRTVLDWKPTELEARSISVLAGAIAKQWKRLGVAKMDVDSVPIQGREKGLHGGFTDASHHMGTTRMGTDLSTSVVDPRCRVHGYSNLYIAGSAVFPTGGFSNPTLTLMALALRAADEIKKTLSDSAEFPAAAFADRQLPAKSPRSPVAEPATA